MPTRKKTTAAEAAIPAGEPKAAPRRRTAALKPPVPEAVQPESPAPKARKTARAAGEKSAAATHKSPAKRAAKTTEISAQSPAAFDIGAHRAEIELEAYFLWERNGRRHGAAHEDWTRAVEIVRARHQ